MNKYIIIGFVFFISCSTPEVKESLEGKLANHILNETGIKDSAYAVLNIKQGAFFESPSENGDTALVDFNGKPCIIFFDFEYYPSFQEELIFSNKQDSIRHFDLQGEWSSEEIRSLPTIKIEELRYKLDIDTNFLRKNKLNELNLLDWEELHKKEIYGLCLFSKSTKINHEYSGYIALQIITELFLYTKVYHYYGLDDERILTELSCKKDSLKKLEAIVINNKIKNLKPLITTEIGSCIE